MASAQLMSRALRSSNPNSFPSMDALIISLTQDFTIASAIAMGAFWIVRCSPILKTSLRVGLSGDYDVARSQQSIEHLPNFGFRNSLLCKSATESSNLSLIAEADVHIQAEAWNNTAKMSDSGKAVGFKQRPKGCAVRV